MKKLLSSMLLLAIIFTLLTPTALANSNADVPEGFIVIKEYDQQEKILSKKATLNVEAPKIENASLVNMETGEEVIPEVIENSVRPIKDLMNKNTGEITTLYAADFTIMSTSGRKSGNSGNNDAYVKFYVTMYYYWTGPSNTYITLDKVDYRWEITYDPNNNLSIEYAKMFIKQYGPSENNGGQLQSKEVDIKSTSGTVLVRDWDWHPVLEDGLGYVISCETTASIYARGVWSFSYLFGL
ncbi:hypothetical protein J40TS1_45110 [Paenibacillus montaniterrae]|uniref:Uncharacterized protein n=1 Tax=Paenibacillus montaniterrae TaxID=429341 RepID=A0A919YUU6_9BACL|nr:hypothetical protein [Paenibacillus montaniterrae]GIP18869.1 hypothetical protein J40TS1_45110 [Paenibacillus montaniterrae]